MTPSLLFFFLLLLSSSSSSATDDHPLYSPIQGNTFLTLSGHALLAWNRTAWEPVGDVDAELVPVFSRGDLAVEFWVRFRPSPDTSEYGKTCAIIQKCH